MAVLNNIKDDLKRLRLSAGFDNDADIATHLGMTRQRYSHMTLHQQFIDKAFIKICEGCGYDIEIKYKKRRKTKD